jgi:hypothetical protein
MDLHNAMQRLCVMLFAPLALAVAALTGLGPAQAADALNPTQTAKMLTINAFMEVSCLPNTCGS